MQGLLRKCLVLITVMSILALLPAHAFGSQAGTGDTVKLAVSRGASYLEKSLPGYQGMLDWPILALSGTGRDVSTWAALREQQVYRKQMFSPTRSTDYHRTLLTAAAVGKTGSFGGRNLLSAVKKSQSASGKFADSIGGGGERLVNAHIWAIISLYAAGQEVSSSGAALDWLVKAQNPDGGFGIETESVSDVDMTAMALVAFRLLGKETSYVPVNRALQYLKRQQKADGSFPGAWGQASSESIAQVIQALIIHGINPTSKEWSGLQGNPITALLSYQNSDGSFSHIKGEKGNMIATYQAVLALQDYRRGESIYRVLHRKNLRFSDIGSQHWAAEQIRELAGKGIITGYPDGTFRPDSSVSRQEFSKMIILAKGIAVRSGSTEFSDVPPDSWGRPYINTAVATGLMRGSSSTAFRPLADITGAEVIAVTVRAAGIQVPAAEEGTPWYSGYVAAARQRGVLYPGFNPTKAASRAQCAYTLAKINP